MTVSRELYLALSRCHAVIMRNGGNLELLNEVEDWLDENIENIEDKLPDNFTY